MDIIDLVGYAYTGGTIALWSSKYVKEIFDILAILFGEKVEEISDAIAKRFPEPLKDYELRV